MLCQDKGIIPLSYSEHLRHKPFSMDFLVLLLSNPQFLYSVNAYGFLFALLEYSRMLLKLCLFLLAAFHLAVASFFQLVFLRLALDYLVSYIIVLYIVLYVNAEIKYCFYVCRVSKVMYDKNSIKSY